MSKYRYIKVVINLLSKLSNMLKCLAQVIILLMSLYIIQSIDFINYDNYYNTDLLLYIEKEKTI